MDRGSVCKTVDETIIDAFENRNFPPERLSVETIIAWLPLELREGPALEIASARAEQWSHPPTLLHLPDPNDPYRTLCGKYVHRLSSLRTPEANHFLLNTAPADDLPMCAECTSKME
jgi:hypothetical protein